MLHFSWCALTNKLAPTPRLYFYLSKVILGKQCSECPGINVLMTTYRMTCWHLRWPAGLRDAVFRSPWKPWGADNRSPQVRGVNQIFLMGDIFNSFSGGASRHMSIDIGRINHTAERNKLATMKVAFVLILGLKIDGGNFSSWMKSLLQFLNLVHGPLNQC